MKCSTELIDKKHQLQAYMSTLKVAKLFYPYAIYELQYNLAVVILWQMLVCTYSSETEAKDELPYYHTIRPKFVCVQ